MLQVLLIVAVFALELERTQDNEVLIEDVALNKIMNLMSEQ